MCASVSPMATSRPRTVTCNVATPQATALSINPVPDLNKRRIMNGILLGAAALPATAMASGFLSIFVPPGESKCGRAASPVLSAILTDVSRTDVRASCGRHGVTTRSQHACMITKLHHSIGHGMHCHRGWPCRCNLIGSCSSVPLSSYSSMASIALNSGVFADIVANSELLVFAVAADRHVAALGSLGDHLQLHVCEFHAGRVVLLAPSLPKMPRGE